MDVERALEPRLLGVLERLREATRSRHATLAASSAMVRLFDAAYTVPEYRAHLSRLLGLFEPLERAAARVSDAKNPTTLGRAEALRDDLRGMGATSRDIDEAERCRSVPPITRAGLPGYTYVMLGSMLGGKIIVERLRAVLGPTARFRFYGDGNARPEVRWASFCSDLEENGKNDTQTICATAASIFDAYGAWLAAPQSASGGH